MLNIGMSGTQEKLIPEIMMDILREEDGILPCIFWRGSRQQVENPFIYF